MRVAAYCRKSTEDSRVDDNKSIHRQMIRCREFAQSRGWQIEDADIYVDDGISGAEYLLREGLNRLHANLSRYDVLITADLDRLGRDSQLNVLLLDDIINQHHIQVWYYQTGQRELADSPEARLMINLRSYAGEMERISASVRSRDTLARKASLGHVTGGRVYGYENVPVFTTDAHGHQVRSHTEQRPLEAEAGVVRAIFTMYADGLGYRDIARVLNGENSPRYLALNCKYLNGVTPPSPSAGNRGSGSWSSSCIQPMLCRERYIGVISYGEYRKTRQRGRKNKRVKQDEFARYEFPHLRLIEQALWDKVQLRVQAHRENYNRQVKAAPPPSAFTVSGTPSSDWALPGLLSKPAAIDTGKSSKYLLTGMMRCALCGGNIVMLGGKPPKNPENDPRKYLYYGCSTHRNRGNSACKNSFRINMLVLDTQVLDQVKKILLTPETRDLMVAQAKDFMTQHGNESDSTQRTEQMKATLSKIERELKNLLGYLAEGSAPKSVLDEIRQREQLREGLQIGLKQEEMVMRQRHQFDEQVLSDWLDEIQPKLGELLSGNLEETRKLLRELLAEPLVATPLASAKGKKQFLITGRTTLGAVIRSAGYIKVASPRGIEPRPPP
ncbi:recombinase family protein [Formivibrio citricus]|uniref:recombinase family protein n=1 Tax=Formivibrio citricus TaxID=83765 RepID=UPI003571191B